MNNLAANLTGILAQLIPPNFVVTQTGATADIQFGNSRFGLYVECRESHGEHFYSLLIWDFGPDNEAVTMFRYDNLMSEIRVEDEILADIFRVQTMLREGRYVEPFFSLAGIAFRSG